MNKLFYGKFHRPFGTQAELFHGNDVEQRGEHLIYSKVLATKCLDTSFKPVPTAVLSKARNRPIEPNDCAPPRGIPRYAPHHQQVVRPVNTVLVLPLTIISGIEHVLVWTHKEQRLGRESRLH